jgi:hypothetical protein
MNMYADMYLPVLDHRLVSIVDNKEGEPIAIGI